MPLRNTLFSNVVDISIEIADFYRDKNREDVYKWHLAIRET